MDSVIDEVRFEAGSIPEEAGRAQEERQCCYGCKFECSPQPPKHDIMMI